MANQKTILITGCSDGSVGSGLALALHDLGWRVFATARNPSKLAAAKAVGIECIQLDVQSDESITSAVQQVKQLTGGSLDALLNNAGTGYSAPIVHIDVDKAHELFDLNVFSIIRVTRAYLPLLLEAKSAMVINNTAGAGLLGCGQAFQGAYAASKAAAMQLTEILRLELAPFDIRVINLVSGAVTSTFWEGAAKPALPADSIYSIARDAIEPLMSGLSPDAKSIDVQTYAKRVAHDISQPKPPYLISRGGMATVARVAAMLPLGMLDGTAKKMSGLDVLEQKIQEKGGVRNLDLA